MTDIKPCPFCGTEPVSYAGYGAMNITCARCSYSVPSVIWNFRPIEDALTARIATLEAYVATQADELADWRNSQAAVMAETCNDKQHCTCVPPLRRRIAELEAGLEQAMVPHDDPENAMHCACVLMLKERIVELESAIAYTDGRNPVTVVVELQQRIRELEAAFTYPDGMRHDGPPQSQQTAPTWTRITDDPATWPSADHRWVIVEANGGFDLVPTRWVRNNPGMYTHWHPMPSQPQP